VDNIAITFGRLLLGLYFLIPGITKITGYAATAEYMTLHNIPMVGVLLPITIVLQVGGGLSLMVGHLIKPVPGVGCAHISNQCRHARFLGHLSRRGHGPRTPKFYKEFGHFRGVARAG